MENQVKNVKEPIFATNEQFLVWKPDLKCPECHKDFAVPCKRKCKNRYLRCFVFLSCASSFSSCFSTGQRKSDSDDYYNFNAPYLLKCGHSVCYKCLLNGWRRGKIDCHVCDVKFDLEKHESGQQMIIRDTVPINCYLQGVLIRQNLDWQRYHDYMKQRKAEETIRGGGGGGNGNLCNECSKEVTKGFCQNCGLFFCKMCFHKLHMTTVSFSKHKLIEFGKL